jgi:hypothetical protein
VKLARVLCALSPKPCSKIRRGGFVDHIQWSLLVPSDPVEVRASLQQVLGRNSLTTMAGTPECPASSLLAAQCSGVSV